MSTDVMKEWHHNYTASFIMQIWTNFMFYRQLLFFARTLMGILDDYFDGYYSEDMIESQVFILLKIFE
jgi:hypothetical protein